MSERRKLIEVALPLEAINRESAREKAIRHGHPSTLHIWWARRPLAACRAVLFASLVDDPSSRPAEFPTEDAQETERQRLFDLIGNLAKWENISDPLVMAEAQREIAKSMGDAPTVVLDPFCGGGSIPLEAQRLGLSVEASDLNPVPVLITKALVELPPKFANKPPINPESASQLQVAGWARAKGLAEDIRYYGRWMRDEAFERIGHLYPQAKLPPKLGGKPAYVIAWLWARTISCPNPACGAKMPLVRSFWLGKKPGKESWLFPVVNRDQLTISFQIGEGASGPPPGTVDRQGARCLICESPVPLSYIRAEGREGRIGVELMGTVAEAARGRAYLPPDSEHADIALVKRPEMAPLTQLPRQALGFRIQGYGFGQHADLFTNRQLVMLTTFSQLVGEARDRALKDGASEAYADALATYLAFIVSRLANRSSTLCLWDSSPGMEAPTSSFARQVLPMTWDFAEANVFSESSGNAAEAAEWVAKVVERLPASGNAFVSQADARKAQSNAEGVVISTDPPLLRQHWLRGSVRFLLHLVTFISPGYLPRPVLDCPDA